MFLETPNEPQRHSLSPFRIEDRTDPKLAQQFDRIENILLPLLVQYGSRLEAPASLEDYIPPSPLPGHISVSAFGMRRSYCVRLGDDAIATVFPSSDRTPQVVIYFRVDEALLPHKDSSHRRAWEEKKMAKLIEWMKSQPGYEELPKRPSGDDSTD